MDVAVTTTIVFLELFGAATIIGGLISAFAHRHPRSRRAAVWLVPGVLSIPMTAFMIAYIFGFAIVLVVFWGFTLLAGWPRIASAFVALCIVAATIAFAISVSTNGPDNLVPTAFFWISATSGLLVFGKLGRIFAQDWLLGHDREKPLAALPS